MGLLDSLIGAATEAAMGAQRGTGGAPAGAAGGLNPQLLITLVSTLLNNAGGLQGLLAKLQSGGLGDAVQSWIGRGQNLPVSADQFVPAVAALLTSAEMLVSLLVAALLFGTIFKVLPDVVLKSRDVVVGAVVTAVLFAIGRDAIALYLAQTATASTYGAAGSVVLILLWVYYSSLILLFGAAFTKTHLLARGRSVVPRNSAVLVHRELVIEVPPA